MSNNVNDQINSKIAAKNASIEHIEKAATIASSPLAIDGFNAEITQLRADIIVLELERELNDAEAEFYAVRAKYDASEDKATAKTPLSAGGRSALYYRVNNVYTRFDAQGLSNHDLASHIAKITVAVDAQGNPVGALERLIAYTNLPLKTYGYARRTR